MDILKFVRNSVRGLFAFILWLNLIACIVYGVILGVGFSDGDAGLVIVYSIMGGILGLLIGGIIVIVLGGFFAIILNIDENLQKIADSSYKNKNVMKKALEEEEYVTLKLDDGEDFEFNLALLKKRMHPNQCVVFIKASRKVEIWNKKYWEQEVTTKNENNFIKVYANY